MIRRYLFPILLAFTLLLMAGSIALASDISGAIYYGVITISNNSTVDASNVATIMTLSSAEMINQGWVDNTFSNIAVRNSSGQDVPFMPSVNSTYPWCFWVPYINANSYINYLMYTGGASMNSTKYYFPADAGMLVNDHATLEIGNIGYVFVDGYIDTSNGTSKYLALKPDALSLMVSPTVSGNITAKIGSTPTENFTSYTEVDPDPSLTVTESTITAVDTLASGDSYIYRDYGVNVTGQFNIDFTLTASAPTIANGYGGIAITNTVNDISGLAATDVWLVGYSSGSFTLQIILGRGNSVATDATANITYGTYYCTLHKDYGNDNVYGYIYSDAAHTTLVDTLTIAGAGANTYYRYSFGFINNNTGVGQQFSGVIADMDITLAATSLAGIISGEHYAELFISSAGNFIQLTTDVSNNISDIYGYGPDTSSNWTFVTNGSMPYMNYAHIGQGTNTTQGLWDWEYNTTFDDNVTGNSNTAYPSFRTIGSDSDVSANLTSFTPIATATAPAYAVSDAPLFITGALTMSSTFTSGNATTNATADVPGAAVITEVSTASGTPTFWLWGIISGFILAGVGFFITYMVRGHGAGWGELFLRIVIASIIFGILITIDKFDFWMLLFYLFIVLAPAVWSRHTDYNGQIGQYNLIGCLSTIWIGLTGINRVIEGQLLQAADTAHLNTFMFTQELTLLDIFNVPVMNFDFFTQGLPALFKWDYAVFGGNAQIFQYMFYSINAVLALIVFGYISGMLASYFTRLR